MPKQEIHYSPAVIARADTSIQDCVRLMNTHGVGSVLIVSDDENESLVGIFTERDLLRKFDLIQGGGFWRDPVRGVMTKPVRVLPASDLHKAPRIMARDHIRHLPVVISDEDTTYKLVGVVSMRDLFKSLVEEREGEVSRAVPEGPEDGAGATDAATTDGGKNDKRGKLAVVTLDPYLTKFIEAGLGKDKVRLKHCALAELKRGAFKPRVVVLDLDNVRPDDWVKLLRDLNRDPIAPLTAVVFNPVLFDQKTVEILHKLEGAERFATFAKPIPAARFFGMLSRFLHAR